MTGWAWTMMAVWPLLLVAIAGAAVWFGVRAGREGATAGRRGPAPAPRDMLDERLARGEIDVDDYQRRLTALRDRP